MMGLLAAAAVLLGKEQWAEVDSREPEKLFAQEVFHTLNSRMPWAPPNGSRIQAWTNRVWQKLVIRKKKQDEGAPDEESHHRR
jgi:hypothetical protein